MNTKDLRPFVSVYIIMTLTLCLSTQKVTPKPSRRILQANLDSPDTVAHRQFELQQQFKNQVDLELDEWVAKQIEENDRFPELQPAQSIIFALRSNVTHDYRLKKQLSNEKRIELTILYVDSDGNYDLVQNPGQQQYVEVLSRNNKQGTYQSEGLSYVNKILELQMPNNEKYLRFRNNGPNKVLILLDIEEESPMMQILLSDDKFTLTQKKMSSMLEEVKGTQIKRQHIYKWEMGFYEMHYRTQYDMLCLTGAELLLIFVTSTVQMYCIKKLIDDQLVI